MNRNRALLLFLLALFPAPLHAREAIPSLFFTPEETAAIETAVRREQPKLLAQAKHVLHCGSIMYVDETQWTVWLQGERWTPETDRPNLHVIEVTPESVRLSVLLSGERTPREVTLSPNQSLNLLTGEVIEGVY